MQSSVLPISTTSRIDRLIRDFVWGGTPEKRKTNLISWDCVCRSKTHGGLGLRKARELNLAYLMKLGWAIVKDPTRLWVRVVTSKYLKETDAGPVLRRKSGGSALWRGIRSVWHTMVGASQQSIRNGKDTLFWLSKWVDSDVVLADYATTPLSDEEQQRTVAEVTNQEAPSRDNCEDELIWGPDPRGKFSIKTAYEILDVCSDTNSESRWRTIWRWKGPNRVRHFLWLVAHGRVLTNYERCRRHIAVDNTCHRCPGTIEDLLHVCRDCPLAREVWTALLPQFATNDFFELNLQDWLSNGLRNEEFCLAFGITIWLLWKARNEEVFEHTHATSDQLRLRVLHWIAGVRETMKADSRVLLNPPSEQEEILIQWNPAPEGFVTINTDGSLIQSSKKAAAGGIIRDWQGRKISVFAANLGVCSIMRAELRAADIGLMIAWDLGFRRVHLQLDSISAVHAICSDIDEDSRHSQTIRSIQERLKKDWVVHISHIYREANKVADLLAHHGHCLDFGISVNNIVPSCIDREIWNDFIGATSPRVIIRNE
ncbi:Putative ribonuclease H protein At1g65750 [Linum perenne]